MKKLTLLISLILMSSVCVQAQVLNRISRKIQNKVEEKIADRIADTIANRVSDAIADDVNKAADKAAEGIEQGINVAEQGLEEANAALEEAGVEYSDDSLTATTPVIEKKRKPCTGKTQTPFFVNKSGKVLLYANKNNKGKIESYTEYTVTNVEYTDDQNYSATYNVNTLNDDKEAVTETMPVAVKVVDGEVFFDPSSMSGALTEGMSISGVGPIIPQCMEVGEDLDDYYIEVEVNGATMTTSLGSNMKVALKENLTVNGESIECYKVNSDIKSKVMGFTVSGKTSTWYARGIGYVKIENYSKKGDLLTSIEIVEIK